MDMLKKIVMSSNKIIPRPKYSLPHIDSSILVLAPHYDDDIIGCGGTLYQYKRLEYEINVVFFTDGKRGTLRNTMDDSISSIRYEEAREALAILGIQQQHIHCIDLEDCNLQQYIEPGVELLNKIIENVNPGLIFLPYMLDIHPDHRAVNYIMYRLLYEHSELLFEKSHFVMYEVWTPLIPNLCINITMDMEKKLEALDQHKSQVEIMRYRELVCSLNSYRACLTNRDDIKYVEGFYQCELKEYKELLDKQMTEGGW